MAYKIIVSSIAVKNIDNAVTYYTEEVSKKVALDFLNENGFEPVLVGSEEEAKSFDIEGNPGKYPIYFFESDTSGEKTYEEFYTEEEDYVIDEFDSLGYINTKAKSILFDEVIRDFDLVFDIVYILSLPDNIL